MYMRTVHVICVCMGMNEREDAFVKTIAYLCMWRALHFALPTQIHALTAISGKPEVTSRYLIDVEIYYT